MKGGWSIKVSTICEKSFHFLNHYKSLSHSLVYLQKGAQVETETLSLPSRVAQQTAGSCTSVFCEGILH